MFEELINFLQLHHAISPNEKALIVENISLRKVPENEILLQEGKYAKEMFFICSGYLKIVTVNSKGNDVTLFFLGPNKLCTILNSFNNNVLANERIVAASNAELIVIPKDNLFNLFKLIPYFKKLIDGITHQALLNKIALRNSYLGEGAAVRYQRFLEQQPEIALHVSLTDIASYLNITPQSLSRIRRGGNRK